MRAENGRVRVVAAPSRTATALATGALVALASVGTSVLVLSSTSDISRDASAPPSREAAAPPELPSGGDVIVVPPRPGTSSGQGTSGSGGGGTGAPRQSPAGVPAPAAPGVLLPPELLPGFVPVPSEDLAGSPPADIAPDAMTDPSGTGDTDLVVAAPAPADERTPPGRRDRPPRREPGSDPARPAAPAEPDVDGEVVIGAGEPEPIDLAPADPDVDDGEVVVGAGEPDPVVPPGRPVLKPFVPPGQVGEPTRAATPQGDRVQDVLHSGHPLAPRGRAYGHALAVPQGGSGHTGPPPEALAERPVLGPPAPPPAPVPAPPAPAAPVVVPPVAAPPAVASAAPRPTQARPPPARPAPQARPGKASAQRPAAGKSGSAGKSSSAKSSAGQGSAGKSDPGRSGAGNGGGAGAPGGNPGKGKGKP